MAQVVGGTVEGAIAGGTIGSFLGPAGTLIGAALGGIIGFFLGVGEQNATQAKETHATTVATTAETHTEDLTAAAIQHAKDIGAEAVTHAAGLGAEAIAHAEELNKQTEAQALRNWASQEMMVGGEKAKLGETLGGMQVQERAAESKTTAATAARGLALSGSPLFQLVSQKQAAAHAFEYTKMEGELAVQGLEYEAASGLLRAKAAEAETSYGAAQYAKETAYGAQDYANKALYAAQTGGAEAVYQAKQYTAETQYQVNQEQSNAWLTAFTDIINTGENAVSLWQPKQKAAAFGG